MVARALIVMLVVLNLGVAAWWLLRAPPVPAAPPELAPGVERLRLAPALSGTASAAMPPPAEQPTPAPADSAQADATQADSVRPVVEAPDAAAADAAQAAAPTQAEVASSVPPATDTAAHACFSAGPFGDADALARARAALAPSTTRIETRQASTKGRWDVYLPPASDRDAAQATVAKLAAASVQDYYIVSGGDAANSIALGRYGSEAAAQRRQQALQAAGFPAQVRAPDAASPSWIDFSAGAGFSAEGAARAIAPATLRETRCASAPAAGASASDAR